MIERFTLASDLGQAFIEFIFSSLVVLILCGGLFRVFATQWKITRCTYRVFEAAHLTRQGSSKRLRFPEVQVIKTLGGYQGMARCEGRIEKVTLPDLESAQWP